MQIYHHDVLVASHVQRRKPNTTPSVPRQGRRTARPASAGIVVTRMVDRSGRLSFAGTMYRAGRAWRGKEVEVCIVAEAVQMNYQGRIVRTQPIRHDRTKEHGVRGRNAELNWYRSDSSTSNNTAAQHKPDLWLLNRNHHSLIRWFAGSARSCGTIDRRAAGRREGS